MSLHLHLQSACKHQAIFTHVHICFPNYIDYLKVEEEEEEEQKHDTCPEMSQTLFLIQSETAF